MAREVNQSVQVDREPGFEVGRRVVESKPTTRSVVVSRLIQFIWLVVGIIAILLSLRFLLLILAANPGAGFAQFIYSVTDIFMIPFSALLPVTDASGGSLVEWASLIAIGVYMLVGWVIVTLIRILFSETRRSRSVTTVERT